MDAGTTFIVFGFALLVLIVVATVVGTRLQEHRNVKQQGELKERLLIQARNFAADVQYKRALPTVPTNILLKPGEAAFYSSPSALYETRAVRQYQSGFSGFRIAKGVYVGGTSGRSTSTQQWAKIDGGVLTITNKRLVFDGGQQDRTVQLGKIVSVSCSLTNIEVSVEGRQKTMVFEAANPLIASAIVRLCRQVDDPLNLSGYQNINLLFE
jgi:hypothetical protein